MSTDALDPEVLDIKVYPDKVLRRRAEPVPRERFGNGLGRLASGMLSLMYESAGVGLAAPQVGLSIRLLVMDPDPDRKSPVVLVNPRIVESSGREAGEEGCLSLPGVAAEVGRAERVTVEFHTVDGKRDAFDAAGLPARIIQHEIDHLDGRLFIDRLNPEGRLAVRDALRELERRAAGGK